MHYGVSFEAASEMTARDRKVFLIALGQIEHGPFNFGTGRFEKPQPKEPRRGKRVR